MVDEIYMNKDKEDLSMAWTSDSGLSIRPSKIELPKEQKVIWNPEEYEIKSITEGEIVFRKLEEEEEE